MTTKQIYNPHTAANPSDRFLAEVRNGGWIIDRSLKDTRVDAQKWLDNHTGTKISPAVLPVYSQMIKRWANK